MIFRKKLRIFSTILSLILILLNSQADFTAFSAENPTDLFVLGGREFLPNSEVMSGGVYVYEVNEGILVYSKNPDKRMLPASTTKIMTALLTLETVDNLDNLVEVPFYISEEFWSGDRNTEDPSLAGIVNGQTNLTYRDVLYAMMVSSGCEAANILAYNLGAGEPSERIPDFAAKMTAKAKEIGCKDTNFSNAHGLYSPNNYSTAYDIFLITMYAYEKHERIFSDIVSTVEYSMPPNSLNPTGYSKMNSNQLLIKRSDHNMNPYYYEYAKGIKTGGFNEYYTKNSEGGWDTHTGVANLVSIATKKEFTYIIVTLGAPWYHKDLREPGEQGLHHAYKDHKNLYEWAFSTFEKKRVMEKNEPIKSVKILDGVKDEIPLYPLMTEDFFALLPKDIDLKSAIEKKPNLNENEVSAPIEQGEVLGVIEIKLANQVLGEWQLISNESVAKSQSSKFRDKLSAVFGNKFFAPVLIIIGALTIVMIILNYINKHRRLQRERFGRVNRTGGGRAKSRSKKPPNKRIRR